MEKQKNTVKKGKIKKVIRFFILSIITAIILEFIYVTYKSIKEFSESEAKEFNEKIVEIKNDNNYLKNMVVELKENADVLDKYDLKKEITKLENRKIWLKCGGFITIDKTEALTAIDVNTGKYTGNKKSKTKL